jgi:[acyl-carrier-protein] S-malonyltransferase
MGAATEPLRQALTDRPPRAAVVPVIANASAQPVQQPHELARELVDQVCSPVRWSESLERLSAMGCDRFLELGPGSVLAGLVKRTLPGARVASFGAPADLEAALGLLGPE